MKGARSLGAGDLGLKGAGVGQATVGHLNTRVNSLLVFSLALLVVRASCEATAYEMVAYLECYRCSAHEYEENFRDKLSQCQSGQVGETVKCPYSFTRVEYGVPKNFDVSPSCTVVKQTAAGVITSYTRGCKFFTNCTDVDQCGESTGETGVCMWCCNSDRCNAAPSVAVNRLQGLWIVTAILVATLLSR